METKIHFDIFSDIQGPQRLYSDVDWILIMAILITVLLAFVILLSWLYHLK